MPSVTVNIDKDDLLEALTDKDLISELEDRGAMPETECECEVAEHCLSDPRQARCTLKEISDLLRNQGKTLLAVSLEDIINELDI